MDIRKSGSTCPNTEILNQEAAAKDGGCTNAKHNQVTTTSVLWTRFKQAKILRSMM